MTRRKAGFLLSCRLQSGRLTVRLRRYFMTGVWALAALWLGLALIASLLSIWLRISTALSEIVVGTIAQLIIGAAIGSAVLGTDESLGQVPVRHRRDRPDLPGRRRTRSAGLQAQMEGGGRDRPRELLPPVSRLRGRRPLPARMGGDAELARRRRHVDHLGGRRLRGDDRVRLQHDRLRQDRAGRLLRHRSRHRRCARPHLCAVHDEDPDLPRASASSSSSSCRG